MKLYVNNIKVLMLSCASRSYVSARTASFVAKPPRLWYTEFFIEHVFQDVGLHWVMGQHIKDVLF